jgi:predicted transglutaminase-like cysteine proteinase
MSASIRARRAARILAGLLVLSACVAAANEAAARIIAARPPLVSPGSSSVATTQAAINPPSHFFSINRILAEHDRRAELSAEPQLASFSRNAVAVEPPLTHQNDEPFGLFTFRAPDGLLWTKWRGVEAEIDQETETLAQCRHDAGSCPSPVALRFLAMIHEARSKTGREKLDTVNRVVNSAIRYASDFAQHGVADLWSAPLASLASGLGDCEDYAIAKYVLLRESGIAPSDLRLLLVYDTLARQDHAVLAARADGRWFILDNRWTLVPGSSEVRHLMPLFEIDHEGVRQFGASNEARLPYENDPDNGSAASESAQANNLPSSM